MSESPPFVWSQNRPPTPSTIRTSGPIATAPSDVSSGDLSENAGSGTQGQCEAASCSNTWLGQEARYDSIYRAVYRAAFRATDRAACRRLFIPDTIHGTCCMTLGTCQCDLIMCGFLLDLKDARKANNAAGIFVRLLEAQLQHQAWLYEGQDNYVTTSKTARIYVKSSCRWLQLVCETTHILGMNFSVVSSLYGPLCFSVTSSLHGQLFEYARDELLERIAQDIWPRRTPTSYVDQSQHIYTCLIMLRLFQQHHALSPYVHIKYAIVLGVQ